MCPRGCPGPGGMRRRDMPQTGRTVPDVNEPPGRFTVTVTAGCQGGSRPGPAAFAAAAGRAARRRPTSIIGAHLAGKIISVVTVSAPGLPAAVSVSLTAASLLRRPGYNFGSRFLGCPRSSEPGRSIGLARKSASTRFW